MLKSKIGKVVLIAYVVGVCYELWRGSYKQAYDIPNKIAVLAGSGFAFLVVATIIPLIVSLLVYARTKAFPKDGFAFYSYLILALLSLVMVIGNLHLDSQAAK